MSNFISNALKFFAHTAILISVLFVSYMLYLSISLVVKSKQLESSTPMMQDVLKNVPLDSTQFNLSNIVKKYIPVGTRTHQAAAYLEKSGADKWTCVQKKNNKSTFNVCGTVITLENFVEIKRIKFSIKTDGQYVIDVYANYQRF